MKKSSDTVPPLVFRDPGSSERQQKSSDAVPARVFSDAGSIETRQSSNDTVPQIDAGYNDTQESHNVSCELNNPCMNGQCYVEDNKIRCKCDLGYGGDICHICETHTMFCLFM